VLIDKKLSQKALGETKPSATGVNIAPLGTSSSSGKLYLKVYKVCKDFINQAQEEHY